MAKKTAKRSSKGRRKLNMERVREKHKEIETRSQGEYHELKQGWNYFFVMPPYSDEGVAWKEVERHGMHVCPKQYGKECILCKEVRKRLKRGDTDFVDKNRLKTQGYWNAIRKSEVKSKNPDAIRVLRTSATVFGEIIDFINEEEIDITDPSAAHVVGIRRKGSNMATRYKTKVSNEPIDISRWITDEMLEGLFDLDTIRAVQPASDKEMRKVIRGGADADDDFDASDLADDPEDEDDGLDEDTVSEDDLFDDPEEEGDEGSEEEEGDGEEEEGDGEEEEGDGEEEEGDDFFDDPEEEEDEPPPPPKPPKKKVKKGTKKKVVKKKSTKRVRE